MYVDVLGKHIAIQKVDMKWITLTCKNFMTSGNLLERNLRSENDVHIDKLLSMQHA